MLLGQCSQRSRGSQRDGRRLGPARPHGHGRTCHCRYNEPSLQSGRDAGPKTQAKRSEGRNALPCVQPNAAVFETVFTDTMVSNTSNVQMIKSGWYFSIYGTFYQNIPKARNGGNAKTQACGGKGPNIEKNKAIQRCRASSIRFLDRFGRIRD